MRSGQAWLDRPTLLVTTGTQSQPGPSLPGRREATMLKFAMILDRPGSLCMDPIQCGNGVRLTKN